MSSASSFQNDSKKPLIVGIVLWSVMTTTGFALLAVYSHSPGEIIDPPHIDKVNTTLANAQGKHLLVMAVHPKCPCTRASIGELARLLRYAEDKLFCQLLVYQPAETVTNWSETDIVASARELPMTEISVDFEGTLAKQFGMVTSGSVVLYSPLGEALFHGGITAARNHHGDNPGSDCILAILDNELAPVEETAVFGCPLQNLDTTCVVAGGTESERKLP